MQEDRQGDEKSTSGKGLNKKQVGETWFAWLRLREGGDGG